MENKSEEATSRGQSAPKQDQLHLFNSWLICL